ncbi:MAG: TROVE domain-containing protein [Coriobacteriia bacterium]|nr:TROVE domain-containing protein [Coriobacteriia bacterium]
MTTFNMKAESTLTRNRSGHVAYRLDPRDRLMSYVLTSFVNEPKYYGDNTPELVTLAKELAATDGLFVAQLAVYARTVLNMRSSSHLLLATLAHEVKGEQYVRRAVRSAVVRGDDVTEMLAAFFALFPGDPLPNSLRRGLRDALDRMSDYELAKYRMSDRPVKMADAVKLCHTRRREATRALLAGELGKPTSWETELSAHGNTTETWEMLLAEGKVPYMALLRNLRNLLETNPAGLDAVLERLADPRMVAASRQLPFRFWSAYRAVEAMQVATTFSGTRIRGLEQMYALFSRTHMPFMGSRPESMDPVDKAMDALSRALDASVANYPKLPGRTLVAVDVSGSMSCRLSSMSTVRYVDVAALLAACLVHLSDDCVVYAFARDAERVPVTAGASVLATMGQFKANGGCTNMEAVFVEATLHRVDVDRMVFLSDNEVNRGYSQRSGRQCLQRNLEAYRRGVGHRVWLHAVDLAGYGTTQFDGVDTTFSAGWSEKVLSFLAMAEEGTGGLEAAVEAVELQ